jgi:hypothetical protein
MAIRVIYKDKNIGIVNESRLNELIISKRIAAFCRPNGEWVGVGHDQTRSGCNYHEHEERQSIQVGAFPNLRIINKGIGSAVKITGNLVKTRFVYACAQLPCFIDIPRSSTHQHNSFAPPPY